jgi:hypothetical protein
MVNALGICDGIAMPYQRLPVTLRPLRERPRPLWDEAEIFCSIRALSDLTSSRYQPFLVILAILSPRLAMLGDLGLSNLWSNCTSLPGVSPLSCAAHGCVLTFSTRQTSTAVGHAARGCQRRRLPAECSQRAGVGTGPKLLIQRLDFDD